MSSIRTLYATLADTAIAYTNEAGASISVTARDLHEVKVEEMEPPVRILMPYRERSAGGSDLRLLTVGTSSVFGEVEWAISDLFLLARSGSGYGVHDYLPDLVRYAGAYAEKIADAGADLGIGVMTFQGLTLDCSQIEWPLQSGNWFYGVEAVLVYTELINP